VPVVPGDESVDSVVVVVLDLLLSGSSLTAEIVSCITLDLVDCSILAIFVVGLTWTAEEVDCTWLVLVQFRSRLGTSLTLWICLFVCLFFYTKLITCTPGWVGRMYSYLIRLVRLSLSSLSTINTALRSDASRTSALLGNS
jgi:hypothetical protein